MKKAISLVLYTILFYPFFALAQQITFNQAKVAAINALKYMREDDDLTEATVDTVLIKLQNNRSLIYGVRFQDGGVVLVSGHTNCTPILGIMKINPENSQFSLFNNQRLPTAFQHLIDVYANQIQYCFDNPLSTNIHPDWMHLLVYDSTIQNREIIVNPLLSSQWGQQHSNDLVNPDDYAYNYYVHNYSCSNTPTGCVAVAMGQILHYWSSLGEYAYNPNQCWGYSWDYMPNKLLYHNGNNSSYISQRNAVAALLRDCGTSVYMHYACDGSYVTYDTLYLIDTAFRNFGFTSHLAYKNVIQSAVWDSWVRRDLDNGCPILYMGGGLGAHAFVCDGYKIVLSEYKYHFNWGWYGDYDGWFTLDDLSPGSSIFSFEQCAVFNIHPSNCWENIVFGCDKYFVHKNASYHAENTIQNNYHVFAVLQDSHVTLKAGDEIILTDGFRVGNRGVFVAKIEACEPDDGNGMPNLEDGIGERALRGDGACPIAATDDGLRLHPNPTTHTLTVETTSPIRTLTVYDLAGRVMMTAEGGMVETCHGASLQVDVSSLPNGIYLLRAVTDSGVETGRFVKN